MEKTDARVLHSKEKIRSEFLRLLKEKPVRQITVTELCQRCQINRTTFYKYFSDPYDVLEKLVQQALAYHRKKMNAHLPGDLDTLYRELLTDMQSYSGVYSSLVSRNGDSDFFRKLLTENSELVFPLVERKFPTLSPWQREMLYRYFTYGSSGVIAAWISGGMAQSVEDIVQFLNRMNESLAAGMSSAQWKERNG